ncbi:EamA family transporter [Anaeromyxobacter terrae]|uniref:EamA family transporter n=1 Tax=Anaeromyxobacter terrae TaxID=2925406 RepID=UPI001F58D679|nr:DMT family transporter [Anaeromyxobacter sp. SG22]
MTPSVAATLLGLASAVSWGAGDFTGGLASKRSPVLGVLALGQAAGVTLIVATALLLREVSPAPATLAWSTAAGASGAVGLAALYRALGEGRMAVVAPVSAVLSASIPVAWSALAEGMPPGSKLAGFVLALAGIWLIARAGPPGAGREGLALALVAGCGFGAYLVLMDRGAQGGTFWPLAAARGTSLVIALVVAAARRRRWAPARPAAPLILLSGVLDAGGNVFFVLATQAGRLDVAAVLSSMYPASTVALAAGVLRERVTRPQSAGILAVLGAIALIAG